MRSMDTTWKRLAATGEFTMKTKAVINGVEYDTITAPVITHGLLPDKTLSVGNCIAGTLQFTVMTNREIPKSAQVVIKSCLSDGTEDSSWYEFGTFWIDKRTVNKELVDYDLVDLECYDAMLKGNQAYSDDSESMNWPKPMLTVVQRIAQQMGVSIDERTQIKSGDDYVVTKPDSETTLLDILGHIGALHGGNWTITPTNKLRLVPIVFQQGQTYNIVDEDGNYITGNGDRLVWKYADTFGDTNNAGGGLLNVPVVTGEIRTFEASYSNDTENKNLGEFTLVNDNLGANALTYFRKIVGNGVGATQINANYRSNVSTPAVFRYSMATGIPADAKVSRVYCEVNGHAQSNTSSNEYMCVQLVSETTALSEQVNFKNTGTTSNTTITLECNTIPTAEQLASLQLECTLGYQGGAINGATVYVVYRRSRTRTVSGVRVSVNTETSYVAGDDSGIELVIENNPYGTQRLCDALLSEFEGAEYVPYEITRAVYDPAVELGDWIVVGDRVSSVLYVETQTLDIGFIANASAPGEEELESEYPYKTALQKMQYTVQRLNDENETIRSEISQTQDSIAFEVSRAKGAETTLLNRVELTEQGLTSKVSKGSIISEINQTPESITINASKLNLSGYVTLTDLSGAGTTTINGANIKTGSISANYISGGTLSGVQLNVGEGNFTVDSNGKLSATNARVSGTIVSTNTSDGISVKLKEGGIYFENQYGQKIEISGRWNGGMSELFSQSYNMYMQVSHLYVSSTNTSFSFEEGLTATITINSVRYRFVHGLYVGSS